MRNVACCKHTKAGFRMRNVACFALRWVESNQSQQCQRKSTDLTRTCRLKRNDASPKKKRREPPTAPTISNIPSAWRDPSNISSQTDAGSTGNHHSRLACTGSIDTSIASIIRCTVGLRRKLAVTRLLAGLAVEHDRNGAYCSTDLMSAGQKIE